MNGPDDEDGEDELEEDFCVHGISMHDDCIICDDELDDWSYFNEYWKFLE